MLLRAINMTGKLHMVPALVNDQYVIRFITCNQNACDDDILFAWKVIGEVAVDVLTACRTSNENDVLKAIQKLGSLHPTEEDDEGLTDTLSVPPPVIAEKPETEHIPEQNEGIDQGEVFLSDVNTSPSISILYDAKQRATTRRRNLLQRMTSDPKFYNSKVLKSMCRDTKRHWSDKAGGT